MKEIDKRALQEWGPFLENIRRDTPVEQLSEARGTIPYEILTSVSPRVKRVYYRE